MDYLPLENKIGQSVRQEAIKFIKRRGYELIERVPEIEEHKEEEKEDVNMDDLPSIMTESV